MWKAFVADLEATGNRPRTNPDGDVSVTINAYATKTDRRT
jgi:hypothetical protein